MWNLILILSMIISTLMTNVKSENAAIFSAISSKTIFPYSVYNISVSVEEGGAPTLFTASISSSGKSYSAQEVEINAGMSNVLSLELNELPDDTYILTIKSDTSGTKYEETSTVFVDRKERSVLIQTDKPIYKPGEIVRFRIVVLNRFLKPFMEIQIVNVKILDPSKNIIKTWDKCNLTNGLFSNKLELSSEPNLGDWSLEVKSKDIIISQQFSVAQYVLPKFKVEVKLPPFITYNSSKIRAEIKATYTYGKGLKGQCTATLIRKGYYYQPGGGELRKTLNKILPIDGTVFVEFDTVKEQFSIVNENSFYNEMEFEVQATVRDELTGKEQNGSSSVKMYKLPYKIEYIEQATSYQPGLPLIMKFKVSTQDNVPIVDPSPDAIVVTHGFAYRTEDSISKAPIPSNGIVAFTFITPSNEYVSISDVEVSYKALKQRFYLPQRIQSVSKTYIQLSLTNEIVIPGEDLILNLKATKEFSSFKYIVYGRGIILHFGVETLPSPAKVHTFKIIAPADAAPEGKVVVYSIFGQNNEIVAHSLNFVLSSIFTNELELKLSDDTLEPGQNLTISMKTKANSLIALRGIDQSILILKDDKDINIGRIEAELKDLNQNRNIRNKIWGGSSSFQIFDQAGLLILTNGFLEKAKYSAPWRRHGEDFNFVRKKGVKLLGFNSVSASSGPSSMNSGVMMKKASKSTASAKDVSTREISEIMVRKNFPETWLWEEFWVDDANSSTSFNKVVPDTLTSWIITGYSLNVQTGIGISLQPLTLKTFRPFFISINLPYAVVKGEVLSLQVLVHNYLSKEVTATIILANEDLKFEFAQSKEKKETEMTREVAVGAAQVSSVKFVIIPTKFGIMMLNLKGKTDIAGDAISQPLTVKPPGHRQTKNSAILFDLRSVKQGNYSLTASFPDKRVPEADTVKITIIADLLGTTISNLDKLLQMPCGCGEQNMIGFVPDIVILDYLTYTKRLTPAIKFKAIKFLESGYQRELTYRHYDGSFSAFGNSDSSGSTWLTAFVVRSFVAAQPYITIDENVIAQSLQYLAFRQQESGNFQELGKVLHSDIQGGSSNGFALTAYTLLAFIEASQNSTKEFGTKYSIQIEKGLNYIGNALKATEPVDNYAMILIAYALELAQHNKKDNFFKLIKDAAIESNDFTHWEPTEEKKKARSFQSLESSVKPVSVEMTSYALMIYMLRNQVKESLSIVKWLLKQRNAEGGFLSTQDTIIGLTALSKFAALTSGASTDLLVKAEYNEGSQEVRVNDENAIILQEFYLPTTTKTVNFVVTGKGTALAQLTWTYYVEDGNSRPAFTINVEAEAVASKLKLNICTKYTAGTLSNMAVIEVNVPSGYSFEHDELALLKTIPKMKRYDLEDMDSKLIIYFDSLDIQKTCLKVTAQRIFSIGKQAPAYVLIYDYYDTTKKARAFYEAPKVAACPVCKEGDECESQNCVI